MIASSIIQCPHCHKRGKLVPNAKMICSFCKTKFEYDEGGELKIISRPKLLSRIRLLLVFELIVTGLTIDQSSPYWCVFDISLIALCGLVIVQGMVEGVITIRGGAVYKHDNPIIFLVIQSLIFLLIVLVFVVSDCRFLSLV